MIVFSHIRPNAAGSGAAGNPDSAFDLLYASHGRFSGDRPSSSQPVSYSTIPDFPDYPVGIFLLAGSEVYKLAPLIASGVAEQTPAQAGIRPNMQIKNNVLTIADAGASAVTVSLLDVQGRLACKKNYIGCAGINLKSLVRSGTYLVHVERAGRTILIDRIVLAN